MVSSILVIGFTRGILLTMKDAMISDTVVYGLSQLLNSSNKMISAVGMLFLQNVINFFITGSSSQATITMPIMAPLADLVGVTRQVAVLAFQMGAGFVDAFTPVSASLIGVLGVARIDWGKWAKFQIKMQAFFFLMGTVAIAIAIAVNLQ